jgi:hypothetical protein
MKGTRGGIKNVVEQEDVPIVEQAINVSIGAQE